MSEYACFSGDIQRPAFAITFKKRSGVGHRPRACVPVANIQWPLSFGNKASQDWHLKIDIATR